MNMVALVDYIVTRIERAQAVRVFGHAHARWWNTVPRHRIATGIAAHVVTVRYPANSPVFRRITERACHPLARQTLNLESCR